MENKPQKRIKVYENTWILVDEDRDPAEAKKNWLEKHHLFKPISQEQVRRETQTVRNGKVMQRSRFKR